MPKFEDLTGQRFERLVVIKRAINGKRKETMWHCICDCGNKTITRSSNLKNRTAKSCGCFRTDSLVSFNLNKGKVEEKIYSCWNGMMKRCYSEKHIGFENWGGRGISVCKEWHDYKVFVQWAIDNGWNERLEIDRINNDGNYEPNNCRFISHRENCLNSRFLISSNKTGYRGTCFDKKKGMMSAQVKYHGKKYHIGYFQTAEEAAYARDKYIIKNGMDLPLNFPELAINGPL